MERIKETIQQVMTSLDQRKRGLRAPDPLGVLKKILTKKELRHIRINYSDKDTVYINVDSSTLMYRLSLEKDRILQELSKKQPAIKNVRFRLGWLAR